MNKLTLLFGLILCLVVVNARHVKEEQTDAMDDVDEGTLRRSHSKPRVRRRRWQMNYGYDPSYFNRRDYERDNQDVIHNIYKLLDEIALSVRRQSTTPPPQPIYIPYPVPYPVPHAVCKPSTAAPVVKPSGIPTPNITSRFPAMEDTNQNWGFVPEEEPEYDIGDGSRPISFDPITPKQYQMRPAPEVEHGSEQAASSQRLPTVQKAEIPTKPGTCNAAILSCCSNSDKLQQKQCFTNAGCSIMSTNSDSACSGDSVQRALNSFKVAYSPTN